MPANKTPMVDRFGPDAAGVELCSDAPLLHEQMARRGSIRQFRKDAVPLQILNRLCALALCAPATSDLQQCDIIIVDALDLKSEIGKLLTGGPLGQE